MKFTKNYNIFCAKIKNVGLEKQLRVKIKKYLYRAVKFAISITELLLIIVVGIQDLYLIPYTFRHIKLNQSNDQL